MTESAKNLGVSLAVGLLAVDAVLVGWNAWLEPARAVAWTSAALLVGVMALALRVPGRPAPAIRDAVVFAGLMLSLSLGMKAAIALGMPDGDLARRGTMIVLGAFLAYTGNAMPKTLTPLSSLRCDPARAQALQRFSGWTWALAGVWFAIVWIALPVEAARRASLGLLLTAMLAVITQMVRLRREARGPAL